ncbi:MAG: PilN domain-containing protein [Lautropia sp.]|nr:PilN domain-containing protein [Lautropia sp.]
MIRINLLPHREQRRERRKRDFTGSMVVAAMIGGGIVFLGGMFINNQIENQNKRNEMIKAENARLDEQIAEIKNLESAIASLKARQNAVEDLQSDRTIPVRMFDELVKITPEGVYLTALTQNDLQVALEGRAQSNERVAELLRNLTEHSKWMEKPQLEEIAEENTQKVGADGYARREHRFRVNVLLKRNDKQTPAGAQPGASVAMNTQGAQ